MPRNKIRNNDTCIAFDRMSVRSIDPDNGYLRVEVSNLTKESVNPYYGDEIPGWQDLGLDPDRIYYGYRSGKELEKAAPTFNGVPILSDHVKDSAEEPQLDLRIGCTGTTCYYDAPYLKDGLVFHVKEWIDAIGEPNEYIDDEDGDESRRRQLSASYKYIPIFKSGKFNGVPYDFEMTEISGNHVALVKKGRAGPDVMVADSALVPRKGKQMAIEDERVAEKIIKAVEGGLVGSSAHPGGREEAEAALSAAGVGDERMTKDELRPAEYRAEGREEEKRKLERRRERMDDRREDRRREGRVDDEDEFGTGRRDLSFDDFDEDLRDLAVKLYEVEDAASDREMAEKLKRMIDQIEGRGGEEDFDAEDEDDIDDEDEDAASDKKWAMDKSPRKGSYMRKGKSKAVAMDSATISTLIERRANRIASDKIDAFTKHQKAMAYARGDVRSIVADEQLLACDSVSSVYKTALRTMGLNAQTNDAMALREMVQMAKKTMPRERNVYPVAESILASDSALGSDDSFSKMFDNINIAQY